MTIAVLLAPACARAQSDHGSGVAFVSATPLAFYKDKKTGRPPAGTPVEVFDGSSARETIRLVPTSAIGSALKVEPASQAVDPGAIASFTVRAVNADTARTGELLALSTDGTLARRPVSLGPSAPPPSAAPPDTLSFGRRKPFAFHGTNVRVGPVRVPGLSGPTPKTTVGSIADGSGNVARVEVNGNQVSISPVEHPGKYSGAVNLNPSNAANPKTTITLNVRDPWLWPAALLILGLLLATLSELWLTRWRPRVQLETKLSRLAKRVTDTTSQIDSQLEEAHEGWRAPQLAGDGSLLATVSQRLKEGLANAASDEERTAFGLAGTEMGKVDTIVHTHENMLGNATRIAQSFNTLKVDAGDERSLVDSGALAKRIGELLDGATITTEAQLNALDAEAKDLLAVVVGVGFLHTAYGALLAKDGDGQGGQIREEITQLLTTAATSDGLDAQQKRYDEVANKVYAVPAVSTRAMLYTPSALRPFADMTLGGALSPFAAAGTEPTPIVPPAGESLSWAARYLALESSVFAGITAVIVFLSGFSALYLSNATFGSLLDYIGVVIWGSTVQGGIALVRRLLPGGVKSLSLS